MSTLEFSYHVRYHIIDMILHLGFGHLGGSLSMTDILSVLYNEEMNIDPKNPSWDQRDYFVLSKGHGGPGLYSALAVKGYFPLEVLHTLNQAPTILPSHPDQKLVPGVDATTGSLGQGISVAVGIAHGLRIQNKTQRVYSIVGDGELQEGQCWEAIQNAAHAKLSNLIVFVDDNKLQLDGDIFAICNPFDIEKKFEAFGWNTYTIDGNDLKEIRKAIDKAKKCTDQPSAIIAHTTKGKGIPYFDTHVCPHHIRIDDLYRQELTKAADHFKKLIEEGAE